MRALYADGKQYRRTLPYLADQSRGGGHSSSGGECRIELEADIGRDQTFVEGDEFEFWFFELPARYSGRPSCSFGWFKPNATHDATPNEISHHELESFAAQ